MAAAAGQRSKCCARCSSRHVSPCFLSGEEEDGEGGSARETSNQSTQTREEEEGEGGQDEEGQMMSTSCLNLHLTANHQRAELRAAASELYEQQKLYLYKLTE